MEVMSNLMRHPLLVFALSFLLMWCAATIGAAYSKKRPLLGKDLRDDFGVILGASLTLLGLIVGFTFSMAVTRYDLRKAFEEGEANAIGTEQVRADLLAPEDAANLRLLLAKYLDQRILFYTTPKGPELDKLNADTAKVQHQLWIVARSSALANPTPVTALAVIGVNDVLNSQGYTQAAWWNRIPVSAWGFVTAIAICCNLLLGYSKRHAGSGRSYLVVLPLLISISFLLIADIDSPRGGLIRVHPRNLESLYQSSEAGSGR